jgi:hypothetical protein
MLAAAVSMICARCHAAMLGAELVPGATTGAGFLANGFVGWPTPGGNGNCRQRSLQERPAMTESGQLLSEHIKLAWIHRLP